MMPRSVFFRPTSVGVFWHCVGDALQATVSEGLAQGPHEAARAGFELTVFLRYNNRHPHAKRGPYRSLEKFPITSPYSQILKSDNKLKLLFQLPAKLNNVLFKVLHGQPSPTCTLQTAYPDNRCNRPEYTPGRNIPGVKS